MKYRVTKYRTLTGSKEIVELPDSVYGEWIIYKDKQPMYHINCFDFENESNQILNALLLKKQKTIQEVIISINSNNGIKLSIERAPLLEIKIDSTIKEFDLKPIPLEWVN